jgi:GNAT superfamily N-acetyltransferase
MQSSGHQLYNSQLNHIASIAECHMACFPDSLAGKLGLKYVKKMLEWFLVDNSRFLFHIELDGQVIGYCGGFVSKGVGDGSSSGMLQHAFTEAILGVAKKPWLVLHKEVRPMYPFIFRNIKRRLFGKTNNPATTVIENKERQKLSGLVVIGVHPQHRGTGIYNELMEEFFVQSKRLNAIGSKLSVKKNNARGIAAYTKFGWQVDEEHATMLVLKKMF